MLDKESLYPLPEGDAKRYNATGPWRKLPSRLDNLDMKGSVGGIALRSHWAYDNEDLPSGTLVCEFPV